MLRPLAPSVAARIADRRPTFSWDDDEAQPYADFPSKGLEKRLAKISGRGSMALMLATGEWVYQRFSKLNTDRRAMQFLEAGWAEQMHPGRGEYVELNDAEWRGRVRGPLATVITIANDGLYCLEEDEDVSQRAVWMTNLAQHVLPSRDAFAAWLAAATRRLLEHHPKKGSKKESTADDEFDLGRPVARELFDTTRPFAISREPLLIRRFLAKLDSANPYLLDDSDENEASEQDGESGDAR